MVEMPLRRSQVYALDVVARDGDERHARRCTSARARTSARSREALGGHCRTLRRTAVGPFRRRGGRRRSGCCRSPRRSRGFRRRRVARVPERGRARACSQLEAGGSSAREGRARSPASSSGGRARSRSAPSTASTSATARSCATAIEAGPARRPWSRSTRTRARCSATRSRCSRRSSGGWSCSPSSASRRRSSSSSRPRWPRSSRRSSRESYLARDRRRGRRRGRVVPLRPRGAAAISALLERLGFAHASRAARRGRLVDADPRSSLADGRRPRRRRAARPAGRGRGHVVSGDARGGTLGFPTANLRTEPTLLVPALRHLRRRGARPPRRDLDRRQPALRRRRAPDRGVPARLRRRPLRPAARRRALGAAPRRGGRSRARRSWSRRSRATSRRRAPRPARESTRDRRRLR